MERLEPFRRNTHVYSDTKGKADRRVSRRQHGLEVQFRCAAILYATVEGLRRKPTRFDPLRQRCFERRNEADTAPVCDPESDHSRRD